MDLLLLRKEKSRCCYTVHSGRDRQIRETHVHAVFFVAPFVRMRRLVRKLWEDTSSKEEEKGDRFAIQTRTYFVLLSVVPRAFSFQLNLNSREE